MDKYYITNSTFNKLAVDFKVKNKVDVNNTWTNLTIKGLMDFFSTTEAEEMYIKKLIIESRLEALKYEKPRFNNTHTFAVKAPRFHVTDECQWMHSQFIDFLVPPQIKVLGEKAVEEYQLYCHENKKELLTLQEEGRIDVFWARVELKFRVKGINPKEVVLPNSGVWQKEIRKLTQSEIEAQIYDEINILNEKLNHSEFGSMVENYRFSSNYPNTNVLNREPESEATIFIKDFFERKKNIKNLMNALFSARTNTKLGLIPENILIQAGLEPCKACFSEKTTSTQSFRPKPKISLTLPNLRRTITA